MWPTQSDHDSNYHLRKLTMADRREMHKTLKRQLRRSGIDATNPDSETLEKLLDMVNKSMHQADETRYTLERSMDLSSKEMRTLYDDLQETSAKLLESEQSKLESVIGSLEQGVCAVSLSGEILFANAAAERLFGFKPSRGRDIIKRITIYDNRGERLNASKITQRAFSGETLNDHAAILTKPNRRSINIAVSLTPLKESDGQATGVVLAIQDLTEHKQNLKDLAEALRNANAAVDAKSAFLATMSHEIRTPLNGVIGMIELLLTTKLNSQQTEYVEIAKRSGDSLLSVINDILDFSKIEAGQIELEAIDFSPRQIVEDAARTLSSKALKTSTHISTDIEDSVPPICSGDMGRIRQVLLNLVGNAVKFTKNGAVKISVSAHPHPTDPHRPSLHFSVSDTGIGIPEDRIEYLFRPFAQVDASTTRKYGGTGLGLAISSELVSMMGGSISVESFEGQGTIFTFIVPVTTTLLRRSDDPDPVENSTLRDVKRPEVPLHLLVAEDSKTNQIVIKSLLETLGHTCKIVEDGEEVIDALEGNNSFDAVLMDCMMPNLDGYDATRAIRSRTTSWSTIPIVALTANALSDDKQKCLEAGMTGYLAKPITRDALLDELRRVPVGQGL